MALLAACGGAAAPSTPSGSAAAAGGTPASTPASVAGSALAKPAASAAASAAAKPVAGAAGYSPTPLNPAVKVKVAGAGLVGEAGIFAAADKGYFKDEGLDVDLNVMPNAADIIPQLIASQLQFGAVAADAALFNAAARDIPVRIVGYTAIIAPYGTSAGFVVRQDLLDSGRWKEPKDFKGMTFASNNARGGQGDVYIEKLGAMGGWGLDDIKQTVVPFAQMPVAFANKAADAGYVVEPFISVMEKQGTAKNVVPVGKVYPGLPAQTMAVSPAFAKEQPEAAQRFVTAWLRGQRDAWHAFVKKDVPPDDMFKILMAHTPVKDPALLARMATFTVDPSGEMDLKELQFEADSFLKYGTLKQKMDASTMVDPSYARRAVELLGRIS
jgi:NitT/TauT family transport system substrate-binding protein